jgi:hypothetical protein
MRDLFTFPNTEAGRNLRNLIAASYQAAGRTISESEEQITAEGITYTLLKLEVGRRVDEGQIAKAMKARKS